MAPIGEIAPGCAKKYNKAIFQNRVAPCAISRMITVPQTKIQRWDQLTYVSKYILRVYTYHMLNESQQKPKPRRQHSTQNKKTGWNKRCPNRNRTREDYACWRDSMMLTYVHTWYQLPRYTSIKIYLIVGLGVLRTCIVDGLLSGRRLVLASSNERDRAPTRHSLLRPSRAFCIHAWPCLRGPRPPHLSGGRLRIIKIM